MKNFKYEVPQELQNKIKSLVDSVEFDNIITSNRSYGAYSDQTINEIEGNYVSGWNPSQDGGFEVTQFWQCDEDSTYHFTEKQTDFMNQQSKYCYESFLSDNELEKDTPYSELSEEQQSELADYEREWFEPALLSLQVFVDRWTRYDNGGYYVTLRLSINYKDAPHYREQYAEDIQQIILERDEFMQLSDDEILNMFNKL